MYVSLLIADKTITRFENIIDLTQPYTTRTTPLEQTKHWLQTKVVPARTLTVALHRAEHLTCTQNT